MAIICGKFILLVRNLNFVLNALCLDFGKGLSTHTTGNAISRKILQ